jgi:hypothetical protein
MPDAKDGLIYTASRFLVPTLFKTSRLCSRRKA